VAQAADRSARTARRRALFAVLAAAALVLVGLRLFALEPFRIPSDSMAPTLLPGDRVLVDKRAYRGGGARRGDLAVFRAPRTGEILLKRIVALAGDTVGIEDGVLVVDGRRPPEPYADPEAIDSVYFGPVRVPAGAVFVLGDNRANSEDSRQFGAVPTSRLIGRVRARIWPPGRWGEPV
jgi:signal peptidase I